MEHVWSGQLGRLLTAVWSRVAVITRSKQSIDVTEMCGQLKLATGCIINNGNCGKIHTQYALRMNFIDRGHINFAFFIAYVYFGFIHHIYPHRASRLAVIGWLRHLSPKGSEVEILDPSAVVTLVW